MPYTLYPDAETARRARLHARGAYQHRLLDGREQWWGPGGEWHDSGKRSIDGLLKRLRGAGYRCAPAMQCSMSISRDAVDRVNWLADQAGAS